MERHLDKNGGIDNTTRFSYDKAGNLTCITDNCGRQTRLEYDLMNREIRRIEKDGSVTRQFYDKNGQLIRTVRPREYNRAGDMGAGTQYAYDKDRNLTGLKTMLGNEILADNQYRYDGNGNRTEKNQLQGTTTYAYDAMKRLQRVEYPDRKEELFYDKAGNRTKRVCNGIEELYRYDKRNRLTTYTKGGVNTEFDYDNAGNPLKDDKARYEYDAFNRNTKVETFSGDIQINRYDGEGLRHEMEENGKLFTFIFRGTEIVAEESKEDKIRYIRTGELLASDAESARTYYHYASDEMGSITHVVTGEEKENVLPGRRYPAGRAEDQILNRYEYDVWGNLTACEEKIKNRFKYNGQQYDQISGQYYLRARYYNPVIGRFAQEDTYHGDGLNLYVYCKNNPVYYVDPIGNICETAANRIREKVNNGTASRNEQKKLAAYDRNEARKRGEVPAGYYQDANGRYHRPNGEFASNAEVGLPGNSDHYLNRPYIRKETIDAVNANTKVDYKTGQIYDSISKKWVDPSNVELGHTKGNEFAYYRNWAESQGMTQKQFNDFMNNPDFYAWQDIYSNRSHKFEAKH